MQHLLQLQLHPLQLQAQLTTVLQARALQQQVSLLVRVQSCECAMKACIAVQLSCSCHARCAMLENGACWQPFVHTLHVVVSHPKPAL